MTTALFAEFRVGYVFRRAISILFRNIASFMGIALVVTTPPYLLMWALTPWDEIGTPANEIADSIVAIVEWLLSYIVTGMLVYATVQALNGRRAGFGECIARGLSFMWRVVLVAIVVMVLTGLATILLIIPGIIVYCALWVALPTAVVEGLGVGASLRRSAELTKGHRWRVFGIIVLATLLSMIVAMVFGIVVSIGAMTQAFSGGAVDVPGAVISGQIANLVTTAFFTALLAATAGVSYHDLRVTKEGIGIEQIAAVFD